MRGDRSLSGSTQWRPRPGWLAAGLAGLLAAGLALAAPGGGGQGREDQATRAAIFREITASELVTRQNAARAFPGDPWSADDDFHNHEQRQARAIAARHRVPIEVVLGAIDEGLRQHWDHPNHPPPIATVPPCHPRPVY
jgi:hypothetical protein